MCPQPPTNPPTPLELEHTARQLLSEFRKQVGTEPQGWLELARKAQQTAVATFPIERQHNALKDYLAHYCEDQRALVIAAHTIALTLWARAGRRVAYGHCLEAACRPLNLDDRTLPERATS